MANKETKELARLYFMRGETQKSIANKIGVTEKTVSRWVDKEGWAEKRAAENITRPELVNKLLITINKLIEQVNESDDPDLISGLGDKLSKLSTTIEKLDKKANVVDAIEVFMAFGKWMQYRSSFDSEITPELLKAINKYQDLYISEQISKKF
jgi:DNA-binding XRE family transcriptional regulator